ncbi:sensor histidine kinase [Nitrospira sp. Kam-Ns4a]
MSVVRAPASESMSERRRHYRRHEDRKLLQRTRELEAVRRICEALFRYVGVRELVEKTLRTALEVVGAEAGSVLLADPNTRRLIFTYVIGEKADLLRGTDIPWDQGLAGAVFTSGEPEVVADVKEDARHFAGIDEMTGYRTRDLITVPLKRWQGKPIGVLQVLNKREGRLGPDDLAILTIVSAISAQTIERAQLYEEARLAEVARLVGDIGHDLRNMLQPVVVGAGLLKAELEEHFRSLDRQGTACGRTSKPGCDELIGMIEENTEHIQHRVKQIADCVKGIITPIAFTVCDVAKVVERVFRSLQVVADERGLALRAQGLDRLPCIQADERLLFNAFYNLVNNALAETPPGGSVTVWGHKDAATGDVVLSVTDTGRGMPPTVRDSLFTDRTISRKPGGTGLGTRIVKDVVDAHGGTITVESLEGSGSTFTIRLPQQRLAGGNHDRLRG